MKKNPDASVVTEVKNSDVDLTAYAIKNNEEDDALNI